MECGDCTTLPTARVLRPIRQFSFAATLCAQCHTSAQSRRHTGSSSPCQMHQCAPTGSSSAAQHQQCAQPVASAPYARQLCSKQPRPRRLWHREATRQGAAPLISHTTWLSRGGADGPDSPFHVLRLAEDGLNNVRSWQMRCGARSWPRTSALRPDRARCVLCRSVGLSSGGGSLASIGRTHLRWTGALCIRYVIEYTALLDKVAATHRRHTDCVAACNPPASRILPSHSWWTRAVVRAAVSY